MSCEHVRTANERCGVMARCGMMGYIFIFLLVILLETVVPCVHLRTLENICSVR